jgi:catalase
MISYALPSQFRCLHKRLPESGPAYVSDDEGAKRPPTALADNLRAALEKGPVKFLPLVQLAAADDPTSDATKVWPDSHRPSSLAKLQLRRHWTPKKSKTDSCSCRPT